MWITLEQLQCFQSVMEKGSLSASSEVLGKAKSAVAYSINKLEEQVSFPLFERGKYRLQPTPRAYELLDQGELLLKQAESFRQFAKQLAEGVEGSISISCSDIYPLDEFNGAIKKVMERFPGTKITMEREILSGEKMITQDKVDIAIFEELRNKSDLEYKKLGKVNLWLVIASNHPYFDKSKKQRKIEDLYRTPQIIQKSTLPSDESFGVQREAIKWFVTDTETKRQMILEGLGWGRLPRERIDDDIKSGRLVHLKELALDDVTEIYLVRKKAKRHGQVSNFIWSLF